MSQNLSYLRDAPLDFKGGGAGSLGRDKFFFSPAWQGKFFYFQYLMGQVFFFLALDGASFFFFFLIKFVFNTHFQMKLR